MASRNPESAILIINNPSSAVDILRIIGQFSRVFSRHPIKILRGDTPSDRNNIIKISNKYSVQSVPALITRDNSVLVGRAKICSFLPQLAHAINNETKRTQGLLNLNDETFREHQLRESERMDEHGEDGDEPDEAGEISKRIAKYREEMERRNAGILKYNDPRARGNSCESMTNPDNRPQSIARGRGAQQCTPRQQCAPRADPRAAQQCAPRTRSREIQNAPSKTQTTRLVRDGDDRFDNKFFEMFEETPQTSGFQTLPKKGDDKFNNKFFEMLEETPSESRIMPNKGGVDKFDNKFLEMLEETQ